MRLDLAKQKPRASAATPALAIQLFHTFIYRPIYRFIFQKIKLIN